ncbi:MAG: hypothetical protein ABJP45_06790 [Cyclobacteriaceae bacterium]
MNLKNLTYMLFLSFLVPNYLQAQVVREKCLTSNDSDDRYATYSPDGSQILFESIRNGNWDIYVMEADGSNPTPLTTNASEDRRPSWHPDGKKILFESNRNGEFELFEILLPTGKIESLNAEIKGQEPYFARYSPNGNFIALSLKKGEVAEVCYMKTNGTDLVYLTNFGFRTFFPQWSSDAKSILFQSRFETNNEDDEIYMMQLDGSEITRLTTWPTHNFCPSLSNKGDRIAYATSMKDSRPEIYVASADGSNPLRITNNAEGETLPTWSPTDSKLLVTAYRNGNYEICEISLENF